LAIPREQGQSVPVSGDQGFLLGARPALYAAFGFDCLDAGCEVLAPHNRNRAARVGIFAPDASLMLTDPDSRLSVWPV
jgi:hypothetical protein